MPYKFGTDWARRTLGAARKDRRTAKEGSDLRQQLVDEAKAAGANLANEGEGGLDPALALKVFQRDKFTCCIPKCSTPKKDLDLDHLSGHPLELAEDPEADKWLKEQAKKPKDDSMGGLHVICKRHHDLVHERERALEDGKKPPEMAK